MTVMPGYQMLWSMAILILLESVPTMANDIFILGGQGGHALLDDEEDDDFDDDDITNNNNNNTRMNIGQDTLVTSGVNDEDDNKNDNMNVAPSAPVAGDILGVNDAIMVNQDTPAKDNDAVNVMNANTDAP